MKISFLASLLFLSAQLSFAQIIQSSNDSIFFSNTVVGTKDSIQINLQNLSSQALQINNVKFYTIYGNFPFSSSQTNFSIPANGTVNLWIYFEPEHNILHNSELVIFHNGKAGAKSIDLRGQGVFSNPYYNTTQNLEEQALKNALKARLGQGYNQLSYSAARDAMFMTIDNKRLNGQGAPVNRIECVYTGYNKSSYTSRSNAQSTNPQFNTEHTFPQGTFNSVLPERSDLHHLFPTTNNSNSQRGSKRFGNVTNGTPVTLGGGSFYNSTTFEPRNQQKGKAARALMYFVIRYQDYGNHFGPQSSICLNWHDSYPPDSIERRRNDDIFVVQGNRNPFVDYPQLAERITNFVGNSVSAVVNGLDITQTSIDFGTLTNQLSDTFLYVIVNRGNRAVSFSNFSLSNTSLLNFTSGFGASQSILPGDALIIPIVFQSASSVNLIESLSFNTSLPGGQSSFTIPIRGNSVIVGLNEASNTQSVRIFPNPFEDVLNIENLENSSKRIRIIDSKGAVVLDRVLQSSSTQLDLSNLAKGNYILEIEGEERIKIQKGF